MPTRPGTTLLKTASILYLVFTGAAFLLGLLFLLATSVAPTLFSIMLGDAFIFQILSLTLLSGYGTALGIVGLKSRGNPQKKPTLWIMILIAFVLHIAYIILNGIDLTTRSGLIPAILFSINFVPAILFLTAVLRLKNAGKEPGQ